MVHSRSYEISESFELIEQLKCLNKNDEDFEKKLFSYTDELQYYLRLIDETLNNLENKNAKDQRNILRVKIKEEINDKLKDKEPIILNVNDGDNIESVYELYNIWEKGNVYKNIRYRSSGKKMLKKENLTETNVKCFDKLTLKESCTAEKLPETIITTSDTTVARYIKFVDIINKYQSLLHLKLSYCNIVEYFHKEDYTEDELNCLRQEAIPKFVKLAEQIRKKVVIENVDKKEKFDEDQVVDE